MKAFPFAETLFVTSGNVFEKPLVTCFQGTSANYVVFDNVGSYSIVLKPPFILPNFAILDYDMDSDKPEMIKPQESFEEIFRTFSF